MNNIFDLNSSCKHHADKKFVVQKTGKNYHGEDIVFNITKCTGKFKKIIGKETEIIDCNHTFIEPVGKIVN